MMGAIRFREILLWSEVSLEDFNPHDVHDSSLFWDLEREKRLHGKEDSWSSSWRFLMLPSASAHSSVCLSYGVLMLSFATVSTICPAPCLNCYSVTGSADSRLSPAVRLPPRVTVITTIHQRPNPFTGESQQTVTSDWITVEMIGYIWTKQPDCIIRTAQSPAR